MIIKIFIKILWTPTVTKRDWLTYHTHLLVVLWPSTTFNCFRPELPWLKFKVENPEVAKRNRSFLERLPTGGSNQWQDLWNCFYLTLASFVIRFIGKFLISVLITSLDIFLSWLADNIQLKHPQDIFLALFDVTSFAMSSQWHTDHTVHAFDLCVFIKTYVQSCTLPACHDFTEQLQFWS
jgi:hypothetical protein